MHRFVSGLLSGIASSTRSLSTITSSCQPQYTHFAVVKMSGIEVVGLALGVWPVVVNLAEIYKASKEGFPMRVLTMNIVLYERIFKQSVLKLLQGDEELSEKDRIGLVNGDENFATIWKDPEFVDRLKRRLDAQMFDLVQHKMEEVFKLLTSLKKKIEPKDGKDGELVSDRD